jgi:hypothetical protein
VQIFVQDWGEELSFVVSSLPTSLQLLSALSLKTESASLSAPSSPKLQALISDCAGRAYPQAQERVRYFSAT